MSKYDININEQPLWGSYNHITYQLQWHHLDYNFLYWNPLYPCTLRLVNVEIDDWPSTSEILVPFTHNVANILWNIKIDSNQGGGAEFNIAVKQCLRLFLMMLDFDVQFWRLILTLDFDAAIFRTLDDSWGGGQNALFKISAKQCLRILMMLDYDTFI